MRTRCVRVKGSESDVGDGTGHLTNRLSGELSTAIEGIGVRMIGADEGRGHEVRGVATQFGDVYGCLVGLANCNAFDI